MSAIHQTFTLTFAIASTVIIAALSVTEPASAASASSYDPCGSLHNPHPTAAHSYQRGWIYSRKPGLNHRWQHRHP